MSLLSKLIIWSTRNNSPVFDILRILLGFALIAKSILFLGDISSLAEILNSNLGIPVDSGINAITLAHLISIMQLVTGVLILCGILTRLACLFQIPVVFVAVFFIQLRGNSTFPELLYSIAVLLLLLFFLLRGSGKLSIYHFLFL